MQYIARSITAWTSVQIFRGHHVTRRYLSGMQQLLIALCAKLVVARGLFIHCLFSCNKTLCYHELPDYPALLCRTDLELVLEVPVGPQHVCDFTSGTICNYSFSAICLLPYCSALMFDVEGSWWCAVGYTFLVQQWLSCRVRRLASLTLYLCGRRMEEDGEGAASIALLRRVCAKLADRVVLFVGCNYISGAQPRTMSRLLD